MFLTSEIITVQSQATDLLITPVSDPALEALLRPTAEAIAANMTATAVAFALASEDVQGVATAAFLVAMASMLLVTALLVYWLFIYQGRKG